MPRWLRGLTLSGFVDAYAAVNYGFPSPQYGTNRFRAFDHSLGFSLGWAGFNVDWVHPRFEGHLELRYGPTAHAYALSDAGRLGLELVKQGYARWKPAFAGGKLAVDLGKFNSNYGAEVGDSQQNQHYTRTLLYAIGQPFFHTGLRIGYRPIPQLGMTLIGVNGWNNSIDNNAGKTVGLQLTIAPVKMLELYLGYLTGPENPEEVDVECLEDTVFVPDTGLCAPMAGALASTTRVRQAGVNRRFRHFAELIAVISPTDRVTIVLNSDYAEDQLVFNPVTGDYRRVRWLGTVLSARYGFAEHFGAAIRGEYFQDLDGAETGLTDTTGAPVRVHLGSGVITFDWSPLPLLLVKLENRGDFADRAAFVQGYSGLRTWQLTTTLGVVVMTP